MASSVSGDRLIERSLSACVGWDILVYEIDDFDLKIKADGTFLL